MKGENLITLIGGAILTTLILLLAIIANQNEIYLFILAGIIFAMAVGGIVWNKFQELNRTIINTRRNTKKHEAVNRLRREFRGTRLKDIMPLTTSHLDGPGFGDGIYGGSENNEES